MHVCMILHHITVSNHLSESGERRPKNTMPHYDAYREGLQTDDVQLYHQLPSFVEEIKLMYHLAVTKRFREHVE